MEYNNPNNLEEQRQKSITRSLHIVLILTFIGSGIMCLSSLFSGISLPLMKQLFEDNTLVLPEEMSVAMDTFLALPQAYFLLDAILYGLSLAGAIMMWKMRKNGFHFYTVAQLLVIAVSIMFRGRAGVNIGDIMLTVLFIVFYYMTLRSLGLFRGKNNNDEELYGNNDIDDNPDDEYSSAGDTNEDDNDFSENDSSIE